MIAARLLPFLLIISACGSAAGQGDARGPVLFGDNCAPCHGGAGQGNASIAAPAIAGLPEWYVLAQLHKFRDGVRGAHADDAPGLRMRPMSRTLEVDDVPRLAAHVATMPAQEPGRSTVHGDAEKGKAAYATCAACHGAAGEGNEAMSAPPITQLDDWYMATQLHNFKSGVRGANPDDTTGAQMRPMAMMLADDAAVNDVVAYIGTL
ncbi:MAG: cytochrome c oxidase subunit 2 [Myxococcota bacterium]|jgi:cytochrome c oxidase subunit 2